MATSENKVSPRLVEMSQVVLDVAVEMGLDPFPIEYKVVDSGKMYEVAAYGIPGRFSHWTHGRAYHRQKTQYDHGLQKIYELVINTNPSLAFLMNMNSDIQNTLIMAHVTGHVDFFKNNTAFKGTNRQMVETAGMGAQRIRQYEAEHGKLVVEEFLDAVLAVEFNTGSDIPKALDARDYTQKGRERFLALQKAKNPSPYDDVFNFGVKPKEEKKVTVPSPAFQESNLLWFLANFSPKLQAEGIDGEWKKDIIEIVMREMFYFRPQMATKILNEGWASFWHKKIMAELGERGYLSDGEVVEWSRMNSSVLVPHPNDFNPYWLGDLIWQDIDNKYQGVVKPNQRPEKDWLGVDIPTDKYKGNPTYDKFFVRESCATDQEFLRSYLSDNLIREYPDQLSIKFKKGEEVVVVDDPDVMRKLIVRSMDNFGGPDIRVEVGGGDFNGNRELYLKHVSESRGLDVGYTGKVLEYLYQIWGRVGSSRVDLQACKLEYSIVSPK